MDIREQMVEMGKRAKVAARRLSTASGKAKQDALLILADLLESETETINAANRLDLDAAAERGLDKARVQRLTISEKVLNSMIQGCR